MECEPLFQWDLPVPALPTAQPRAHRSLFLASSRPKAVLPTAPRSANDLDLSRDFRLALKRSFSTPVADSPASILSLEADSDSLAKKIKEIRQESDAIATVRKDRVFDQEVTQDEQEIINRRVEIQQRQFREFMEFQFKKKSARIKAVYAWLSDDEVREALNENNDDEDAVLLKFTDKSYLLKIRKTIAFRYNPPEQEESLERTDEQQAALDKFLLKRSKVQQKTTTEDAKKKSMKYVRLRLDDALKQIQDKSTPDDKMFEGWSEARKRAYSQIHTNPNSYYYRFNAPGEKQRNGAWSKEEQKIFFERLAEMGPDGQWGIFSMKTPGRVGYQCSNFYRGLLKSGKIKDANYIKDDKGELRYLFGKKDGGEGVIRTHQKPHILGAGSQSTKSGNYTPSIPRKKRKKYDDDDEDDSGTFHCNVAETLILGDENPLPGFTDPITLEEVQKPAISKYGHVMGYDTWIQCLKGGVCPITKMPLTKRELTVLTFENIEEFRDKIVNQ